jgi:hypothetical protein
MKFKKLFNNISPFRRYLENIRKTKVGEMYSESKETQRLVEERRGSCSGKVFKVRALQCFIDLSTFFFEFYMIYIVSAKC